MVDAAAPRVGTRPVLQDATAAVQLVSPASLLSGALETVQIDLTVPKEHLASPPGWLLQPLSSAPAAGAAAAALQVQDVQLGRVAASSGMQDVALKTSIRADIPGVLSMAICCQPTSTNPLMQLQPCGFVPLLVAPSAAVQR